MFVLSFVLTSLFSLFYVTHEGDRFLHRGWAQRQTNAHSYRPAWDLCILSLLGNNYFKPGLPLFLEKAENIASRRATRVSCQAMASRFWESCAKLRGVVLERVVLVPVTKWMFGNDTWVDSIMEAFFLLEDKKAITSLLYHENKYFCFNSVIDLMHGLLRC